MLPFSLICCTFENKTRWVRFTGNRAIENLFIIIIIIIITLQKLTWSKQRHTSILSKRSHSTTTALLSFTFTEGPNFTFLWRESNFTLAWAKLHFTLAWAKLHFGVGQTSLYLAWVKLHFGVGQTLLYLAWTKLHFGVGQTSLWRVSNFTLAWAKLYFTLAWVKLHFGVMQYQ